MDKISMIKKYNHLTEYSRITSVRPQSLCMQTLQRRVSQSSRPSLTSVTWQLQCNQTNNGTSTAPTAQTQWSTRTRLSALSRLATSARYRHQLLKLETLWNCSYSNSFALWHRTLLEKLLVPQLVKEFSVFYGTWQFITVFTTACHVHTLSQTNNQLPSLSI